MLKKYLREQVIIFLRSRLNATALRKATAFLLVLKGLEKHYSCVTYIASPCAVFTLEAV